MMKNNISDKDRDLIIHTIGRFLPDAKIYLFGSRIKGNNKKYSDLDVLIEPNKKISMENLYNIDEAFQESDLPYIVDFHDRFRIDDHFYNLISPTLVRVA
jgi:predicted nucleotidyltransferase